MLRLKSCRQNSKVRYRALSILSDCLRRSNGIATEIAPANISRGLTRRLEAIRTQYQRELLPLTEQKEALCREIAELKSVRDMFLEETTVLNARNEELAQLSAVYARRIENGHEILSRPLPDSARSSHDTPHGYQQSGLIVPSLSSSTSGSSTVYYDGSESTHMKVLTSPPEFSTPAKGKFKWPGSKPKEVVSPGSHQENTTRKPVHGEHNFQQISILRFARCDHCGDKMWGSQLRCTGLSAIFTMPGCVLTPLCQFAQHRFMFVVLHMCSYPVLKSTDPLKRILKYSVSPSFV